jgi:hypothetical protein
LSEITTVKIEIQRSGFGVAAQWIFNYTVLIFSVNLSLYKCALGTLYSAFCVHAVLIVKKILAVVGCIR